jgi:hypothetical protein
MNDKTDPRLEAAKGWTAEDWERELREDDIPFPDESLTERAVDMLADLDAADRAAGIVRVDTTDETLVERIAEAIYKSDGFEPGYSPEWPDEACDPHTYRRNGSAVLAALREAAQ